MAQPNIGTWTNADGLQVKFGSYYLAPGNFVNRTRALQTTGATRVLEMDVDLSKLAAGNTSFTTDLTNNGTLTGFNIGDVFIPANSVITGVTFVVTTPAAGGTSFTVGTYQAAGTAIGATSLITATAGAVANLATAGNKITGDGSLTAVTNPTAGVGTHNAYIGLTVAGTFTAGTGRLVVNYLEPNVAPANAP